MKLDLDLCREILLKIENEGNVNGLDWMPSIVGYSNEIVLYQQKKMAEAGYLLIKPISGGRTRVDISYSGHEFLKQMLDDNLWNKTKEIAKKSGIELTFETIKAIIPMAIQTLLKVI